MHPEERACAREITAATRGARNPMKARDIATKARQKAIEDGVHPADLRAAWEIVNRTASDKARAAGHRLG